MVKQPKISVVSAIYNSSHIVSEFISEVKKQLENITPEYEDCRKIANAKEIPLKRVYNAVINAIPSIKELS